MESPGECNDAGATGGCSGDLDGVFDGFGTGGEERRLFGVVAGGQLVDLFSQLHIRRVGCDLEGRVGEGGQLSLDGGDNLGVAVPGIGNRDAGCEVDEASVLDVPELGVQCALGVEIAGDANAVGNGCVLARLPLLIQVGHECLRCGMRFPHRLFFTILMFWFIK